jgi:NitT/TauT family transport system substrate-binding protein
MTDTILIEPMAAPGLTRRKLLRAAGVAAVAAPAIIGSRAFAGNRKLTFAWNAGAFCLTPVVAALDRGYFEKNGLDVELINYTGSTDQLLESLATGKADAAWPARTGAACG